MVRVRTMILLCDPDSYLYAYWWRSQVRHRFPLILPLLLVAGNGVRDLFLLFCHCVLVAVNAVRDHFPFILPLCFGCRAFARGSLVSFLPPALPPSLCPKDKAHVETR